MLTGFHLVRRNTLKVKRLGRFAREKPDTVNVGGTKQAELGLQLTDLMT